MTYKPSFIKIDSFELPIFIISLDDDISRRKDLRQFFSDQVVDNYFSASDMRFHSREELDEFCDNQYLLSNPTYSRKLRGAEIGCSISHKRIYEYIVENELPFAMVCEDDVLPLPKWQIIVRRTVRMIRSLEADQAILIHLGLPYYRSVGNKKVVLYDGTTLSLFPEIRLVQPDQENKFWFGHSYIITYESAKRIINKSPLLFCMCDDWQEFYTRNCFDAVFVTKCVFQQNFKHESNLRLIHPAELFNAKSNELVITLTKGLKGLMTGILDLVGFFNPTKWVFIKLRDKV